MNKDEDVNRDSRYREGGNEESRKGETRRGRDWKSIYSAGDENNKKDIRLDSDKGKEEEGGTENQ